MNQPNSRAETVPKIAKLKLSSCGLEVADLRKNCDCGIVELRLWSNIYLKVAELRLWKCFLQVAELRLRTQKKVPRAHVWVYWLITKTVEFFFLQKTPQCASIQSTCLLFLHTVHGQDNKKFRPVGYFGNRLWYLRCQTLNFGMFKNVCGKKFCFLLLKAKIQSHHSSYLLLCAKGNVSNFAR